MDLVVLWAKFHVHHSEYTGITASILGSQPVHWETSLLSLCAHEFRPNVRSVKDSKDPEAVQTLLFVTNKHVQQNLFDVFFLSVSSFK